LDTDLSPQKKSRILDLRGSILWQRKHQFRRVLGENSEYRLSEAGEDGEQIPVCGLKVKEFRYFGGAVAVYFLGYLSIVAVGLIISVINGGAFWYYQGADYSDHQPGVWALLKGSAVCTKQEVVILSDTNEAVTRNACALGWPIAVADVVASILLWLWLALAAWYSSVLVQEEAQLATSARRYGVLVKDPDSDAFDADEWREFFQQWGHVATVTIGINNGRLLKLLRRRRDLCLMLDDDHASVHAWYQTAFQVTACDDLKMKANAHAAVLPSYTAEPSASKNNNETMSLLRQEVDATRNGSPAIGTSTGRGFFHQIQKVLHSIGFQQGFCFYSTELFELDREILLHLDNIRSSPERIKVSAVIVAFEEERAQRRCLQSLRLGLYNSITDTGHIAEEHRFRGDNVLMVEKAPDPKEIIWENLGTGGWNQIQRMCTVIFSSGFLFLSYVLQRFVWAAFSGQPLSQSVCTGLTVVCVNMITPCYVWCLMNAFETHMTATSRQTSAQHQMMFIRGVNSTVFVYLLLPFDQLLSETSIRLVFVILVLEAFLPPTIALLDIPGLWRRMALSQSARTQVYLNHLMEAAPTDYADMHTNFCNKLLLCHFWNVLLPVAIPICVVGGLYRFWVDKYMLLRSWRRHDVHRDRYESVGERAAMTQRTHLLLLAWARMIIALRIFASWPFDSACALDPEEAKLDPDAASFRSCNRQPDFGIPFFFPHISDWMDSMQQRVVIVYSMFLAAVTSYLLIWYSGFGGFWSIRSLCYGLEQVSKDPESKIGYSETEGILAYIPRVALDLGGWMLACDTRSFDAFSFSGRSCTWHNKADPDRPCVSQENPKDAKSSHHEDEDSERKFSANSKLWDNQDPISSEQSKSKENLRDDVKDLFIRRLGSTTIGTPIFSRMVQYHRSKHFDPIYSRVLPQVTSYVNYKAAVVETSTEDAETPENASSMHQGYGTLRVDGFKDSHMYSYVATPESSMAPDRHSQTKSTRFEL